LSECAGLDLEVGEASSFARNAQEFNVHGMPDVGANFSRPKEQAALTARLWADLTLSDDSMGR
jgi:hypothetical protein